MNPVAILSGLLGLWGQWTKSRPVVSVIADPIFGSGQRYLYVVVKNPAQAQIRITSVSVDPPLFEVWSNDSVDGATDAWNGIKASAFIDPEAEHRFPINVPGDVSEENQDILCKITVRWQSMRHENIPCIPAIHRKSIRTLRAQQNNKA